MTESHAIDSLDEALAEGLSTGSFFTAAEYQPLCAYAAAANAKNRSLISLILPILDKDNVLRLIPEAIRTIAGEFVILACVDISPRSAFLLVSNLPLQKSAREMLSDNGLTLQDLSVREVQGRGLASGRKTGKGKE